MNRQQWNQLQEMKKLGYVLDFIPKKSLIYDRILGYIGVPLWDDQILFVPDACVLLLDDQEFAHVMLLTRYLDVEQNGNIGKINRDKIADKWMFLHKRLYDVPVSLIEESMIPELDLVSFTWKSSHIANGMFVTAFLRREHIRYQPVYELSKDMCLERTSLLSTGCEVVLPDTKVQVSFSSRKSWKKVYQKISAELLMQDYLLPLRAANVSESLDTYCESYEFVNFSD